MIDLLAGLTIGLHVGSVHFPAEDYLNNVNPGIYVRHDSGVVVGTYRNSFKRNSFYAGYQFERGPFSVVVGAISGYQIKKGACTASQAQYDWCEYGNTKGAIGLLVAPSVVLPSFAGITPRITVLPKFSAKGHTVAHLSLEHKF